MGSGGDIACTPMSVVPGKRSCLVCAIAAGVSACAGPQSALYPAGRDAAQIADLFWVMTMGALIVWAAVVALAVYTIRVHDSHSQRTANLLIIGGGVAVPTVVLGALIAYGMPLVPVVLSLPEGGLSVQVTAKQWWWRFEYRTRDGLIETANDLRLPVGERIELHLTSPDVIHSFWVPSLAGKMDMIPGRLTRLALEPTQTGTFRGACAEYCGASHALMAFSVVVMEPRAFRAWLTTQARPAISPADAVTARGEARFSANGCSACHTIRGTAATGRIGPDLTHVGSRLRIAAETLPNEREALVRWIAQTDRMKPGVHMPAFRGLGTDDVSAMAAYLGSLQ
jgi:cytochrome c oxidase subunit 2